MKNVVVKDFYFLISKHLGRLFGLFCFSNRNKGSLTPSMTFSLFCSQKAWQVPVSPLLWCSPPAPPQHHYSGIRHQHQPFKSNVFLLHCNYCMHACAGGTHLLLSASLPWWPSEQAPLFSWAVCMGVYVCVAFELTIMLFNREVNYKVRYAWKSLFVGFGNGTQWCRCTYLPIFIYLKQMCAELWFLFCFYSHLCL